MSELRAHPRAPIELKVAYPRMNAFFADYTRDISKGGVFIKTEDPLEVGTEFEFQITLPRRPQALRLRGRVMWVGAGTGDRHSTATGARGMGIQFVWEQDLARIEFEAIVERLMTQMYGETLYRRLVDHGRARSE